MGAQSLRMSFGLALPHDLSLEPSRRLFNGFKSLLAFFYLNLIERLRLAELFDGRDRLVLHQNFILFVIIDNGFGSFNIKHVGCIHVSVKNLLYFLIMFR